MSSVGEAVAAPDVPVAVPRDHGWGSPEPKVRVLDLSKGYRRIDGGETRALDRVSFDVHAGQLVVVVGPPGCGHTTLLRTIAGIEAPDDGRVEIRGDACFDAAHGGYVSVDRRRVSLIPSRPQLPPHLTALEIVAEPAVSDRRRRDRSRPRPALEEGDGSVARARRALAAVGLIDRGDERPASLSGGQRQRVALARALMAGADLVLFDEPFAAVDGVERSRLRRELRAMPHDLGFSAIVVTHDGAEAMDLADRLAVMDRGRVAQFGAPRDVYDEPVSRHVAACTGTANEVVGVAGGRDAAGMVQVHTPLGPVTGRSGHGRVAAGDRAVALWRPERTRLGCTEPAGPNRWPVTVDASLFLDEHTQQAARVNGHRFLVWQRGGGARAGDRAWLAVDPADVRVLPADD